MVVAYDIFHRRTLVRRVVLVAALILLSGDVFAGPKENAQNLFKRLTGTVLAPNDPRLALMTQKMTAGDSLGAARIATEDDGFYNNTLKRWAAGMSNVSETPIFRGSRTGPYISTNDFVATVIGATRDNWDARALLTTDLIYKADKSVEKPGAKPPLDGTAGTYATPGDAATSIHSDLTLAATNGHYIYLDEQGVNLRKVLVPARKLIVTTGHPGSSLSNTGPQPTVEPLQDAAGLLTTQAFLAAHLYMGTNRRLIEFAFREFTCKPITEWADSKSVTFENSHLVVRRDVERTPGGDAEKFKNTCLSCHGGLDGLAGATAHFDLVETSGGFFGGSGHVAYSKIQKTGFKIDKNGVFTKHNKNNQVFSAGKQVIDDAWVNYATKGQNVDFGWSGELKGRGMKEFGKMLANSRAFSACMVTRVFQAVCQREPTAAEQPVLKTLTDNFPKDSYNLRVLFERAAVVPSCMSQKN